MSIEPSASGAKTARREYETGSGTGPWASPPSKGNPISSIWDQAISGAQKLFGLDRGQPPPEEELDQKETRERDATRAGKFMGETSHAAGFAGRSADSAFGLITTARRPIEEKESNVARDEQDRPVLKDDDRVQSRQDADRARRARAESDEREEDDESDSSARRVGDAMLLPEITRLQVSAADAPSPAVSQPVATTGPQNSGADAEPVVSTTNSKSTPTVSASAENVAAAPGASSQVVEASLSTSRQLRPEPNSLSDKPIVPSLSKETPASAVQAAPVLAASGEVAGEKPIHAPVQMQSDERPLTDAKQTRLPAANGSSAESEKPAAAAPAMAAASKEAASSARDGTSSLSIDLKEAQAKISESLQRGTSVEPALAPKTQPVTGLRGQSEVQTNQVSSDAKPVLESAPTRLADASAPAVPATASGEEAKQPPLATSQSFKSSSARPSAAETAAAPSRGSAASDKAASEQVSAANQSSSHQVGPAAAQPAAVAREGRVVVAPVSVPNHSGTQPNPTQLATGAVGGVASIAGASGSGAASSFQQGGAGGQSEGAPKHETLGSAASAGAKAAEKRSGDAGQAFDVKAGSADPSRREVAASRVAPTSYSSKTVDEIKETVAMLNRSIDRVVTTGPQGSLNVRITFDQGGSMMLRVSMDGGQVNTSMQTDVAGLEGAIKAHWSELSQAWNQKGVRLNAPQFQQGSDAGDSSSSNQQWSELGQGGRDRSRNFTGAGSPQGSRFGGPSSTSASATSAGAAGAASADASSASPDTELHAYA